VVNKPAGLKTGEAVGLRRWDRACPSLSRSWTKEGALGAEVLRADRKLRELRVVKAKAARTGAGRDFNFVQGPEVVRASWRPATAAGGVAVTIPGNAEAFLETPRGREMFPNFHAQFACKLAPSEMPDQGGAASTQGAPGTAAPPPATQVINAMLDKVNHGMAAVPTPIGGEQDGEDPGELLWCWYTKSSDRKDVSVIGGVLAVDLTMNKT
jgi:hypothetical protein